MRHFFLLSFMLLVFTLLFAQVDVRNRNFYEQFYSSKILEKATEVNRYPKVKGSPYTNQEFIEGVIEMKKGQIFENIPLRYNIYKGKMEFEKDKVPYEIIGAEHINKIKLNNETYVYLSSNRNGKIKSFFYVQHNEGSVQLLEKKNVTFKPAEKTKGYVEAKPPRFIEAPSVYYLKFGDQPAVEINKRKHIARLFPTHKSELAKYVKKKRVGIRDAKELLSLINYYQELCK